MKPVVVVGGGIAGVSAAREIERAGRKAVVAEREEALGGRFATLAGPDWIADTGIPYFRHSDQSLLAMVRDMGLDPHVVILQDAIHRFTAQKTIQQGSDSFDSARVSLRHGNASLFDALEKRLRIFRRANVGALRWLSDEGGYILRDQSNGMALRHPESDERILAAGVVVALPAPEAHRIAEGSRGLESAADVLSRIKYGRCFTAVFRTPRIDPGYYALEGDERAPLEWLAFEERKHPGRAKAKDSVIVARTGGDFSDDLFARRDVEALERLWAMVRSVVDGLPAAPRVSYAVRWRAARPLSVTGFDTLNDLADGGERPIALAGDYFGGTAESAAASGIAAARRVLARLA